MWTHSILFIFKFKPTVPAARPNSNYQGKHWNPDGTNNKTRLVSILYTGRPSQHTDVLWKKIFYPVVVMFVDHSVFFFTPQQQNHLKQSKRRKRPKVTAILYFPIPHNWHSVCPPSPVPSCPFLCKLLLWNAFGRSAYSQEHFRTTVCTKMGGGTEWIHGELENT